MITRDKIWFDTQELNHEELKVLLYIFESLGDDVNERSKVDILHNFKVSNHYLHFLDGNEWITAYEIPILKHKFDVKRFINMLLADFALQTHEEVEHECLKKFIEGAKWQQEQNKKLYSEEEVHEIILSYQNNVENSPNHITYNEWFEQFKKK